MEEFRAFRSNGSPNIWHNMKLFEVLAAHVKEPTFFPP